MAAAATLPRLVMVKSYYGKGNAYYREEDGAVAVGDESVFSEAVKIEIERATSSDKYVHLRFCHSNRYWRLSENSSFIVAESTMPKEDTTKRSCTLFEVHNVAYRDGVFYLTHVQSGSGRRLRISDSVFRFYVDLLPGAEDGYLMCVDLETIVKLPKQVALKGGNGMYLNLNVAESMEDFYQEMTFTSEDPNALSSGYEVELMPDGHVRIHAAYDSAIVWRYGPTDEPWVVGRRAEDVPENDNRTLFWPVKIDNTTIALRNAAINRFCKRLTADGKTNGLAAAADTITREARLQVEELVLHRKIYYVRYRMEDARIFGETPYLAGTARLTNSSDSEDAMEVSITYQDEKSYTFSRGVSVSTGVSTTIETGVPFIVEGKIEASFEIRGSFQWDTATTTITSITASGTILVPARSTAVVDYVGTRGTCNIPYSYTQEDKSSTSGMPVRSQQIDGIYNGVSYYNFDFRVRSIKAII